MKPTPLSRAIGTTVLAAAGLSACVVTPAPYPGTQPVYPSYPVYSQPAPAGAVIIAPLAPPPPHVEVIPAAPFVGALWISGYWNWSNNRHIWVPGHYVRPVTGHRFVPHRWEPGRSGWSLIGGFWIR